MYLPKLPTYLLTNIPALLSQFIDFANIITIFTTNICEKNDHQVYGAWIWTHDLRNLSLFP